MREGSDRNVTKLPRLPSSSKNCADQLSPRSVSISRSAKAATHAAYTLGVRFSGTLKLRGPSYDSVSVAPFELVWRFVRAWQTDDGMYDTPVVSRDAESVSLRWPRFRAWETRRGPSASGSVPKVAEFGTGESIGEGERRARRGRAGQRFRSAIVVGCEISRPCIEPRQLCRKA
jgi:hypothetical protein